MRKLRNLAAALLITVGVGGGLAVAAATSAYAITDQICDQITNGHADGGCFNAWNGGPYLKSGSPNTNNGNFTWQFIHGRCDSSIYTTVNCPLAGMPAGHAIFQVRYLNSSTCVGDLNGSSGDAHAASNRTCNNVNTGYGGDYGTVYVQTPCNNAQFTAFISVHWSTDANSGIRFIGYADQGIWGEQMWQNLVGNGGYSVCWINF